MFNVIEFTIIDRRCEENISEVRNVVLDAVEHVLGADRVKIVCMIVKNGVFRSRTIGIQVTFDRPVDDRFHDILNNEVNAQLMKYWRLR